MVSPTERTFTEFAKRGLKKGLHYDVVERFIKGAMGHGVRKDFLGFIDVILLDPEKGFVGVQITGNDYSGHLKKLQYERPLECLYWLRFPHATTSIELWAWRKVKAKRGGKQMLWKPRIEIITEEMILDGRQESELGKKEEVVKLEPMDVFQASLPIHQQTLEIF